MKKRNKRQDTNLQPTESELIDLYIEQLEEKDKANRHIKYKPRYKRRRRFVLPIFIIVLLLAVLLGLIVGGVIKLPKIGSGESSALNSSASAAQPKPVPATKVEYVEPTMPKDIYAVTVVPNQDFELATPTEFENLAKKVKGNGFTTIFMDFTAGVGIITENAEDKNAVLQAISTAKEQNLSVFALVDVSKLAVGDFTTSESVKYISEKLEEVSKLTDIGGIMLTGLELPAENVPYAEYVKNGTLSGYEEFCRQKLNGFVEQMNRAVKTASPKLLLGLVCNSIYATDKTLEGGMKVESDTDLLHSGNADPLYWMNNRCFDITFVKMTTTTNSSKIPFETVLNWWNDNTPANHHLGFMLSSELAAKATGNWSNPDQLGRQLSAIKKIGKYILCFDSYSAMEKDTTGFANLVYKYLKDGFSESYVLKELTITAPKKTTITVYENTVSIIGASDPNFPLLINSKEVERNELGFFSLDFELKVGSNRFTIEHKGKSVTYNVTYDYVVLKDCSPTEKVSLDGGSSLMVKVTARNGSTVKATLKDITVNLLKAEGEENSDFSTYMGVITLPDGFKADTSLGKIVFTGTHNGVTDTLKGGSVTVKKTVEPEPAPPPSDEGYIGVGNTLIAEVTKYQVETFDGETTDDFSQPYNNYLPKGTVDYCDEKTTYDPSSGNTYRLLRYGKRVYATGKGTANIKTFRGTLPETNQLSAKSIKVEGSHTVLTLQTAWKAPFKFVLAPQKYNTGSTNQRGAITAATFNYIDITFCYASQLEGSFEELNNSPIFSRVEVIKNTADYTLRLYLKSTGAFYGWTAEYNSDGDLEFRFLNPAKATVSDNKYGGRLDGITIVVDAGHGGSDGGAVGSNPNYDEANRNLLLAEMLKERLESLGAKVVMTRTSDVSLTSDERILAVKNAKANLAISVHRDSTTTTSPNGFGAYYFNAFTKNAAEKIQKRIENAGVYSKTSVKWHYFYLSRISDCPVVLTENGFMSNATDFNNMLSNSWNEACADAIVKGVVDYFLAM